MERLENMLLETISFFEDMNKEKIILELDVNEEDDFQPNHEDLNLALKSLEKRKLLLKRKINKEYCWRRKLPTKGLARKITNFLRF